MTIHLANSAGAFLAALVCTWVAIALAMGALKLQTLKAPATLMRLGAILLLALSLSGPSLVRTIQLSHGAILTDISESMDEGTAEALLTRAKSFGGSHAELDIVPFAKIAAPIGIPAGSAGSFAALRSAWSKLNIGNTNLEDALQTVAGGEEQSVLLISDGFENQGSVSRILGTLAAHHNRIFPLIPPNADAVSGRFEISQLHAPLIAPAQKSVEIRTSLHNGTAHAERGTLEIKHGDKVVLTRQVTVGPGDETVVFAESDPQSEGIKEITATLTPDRSELGQSIARIYLSTEEREKVLLVSGSAEDERILKQVLKEEAYQVKPVLTGQSDVATLNPADYSVVLFNNVSRDDLPRKFLESIPDYVKNGGGFAMIGGNKSFGLGNYIDSAIAPILPVELVPPQTEKKRLNVAVSLVIDKSGSMSQNSKEDFAKESALEVIRNLKDDDYISVIGFDDAPFVVIKNSLVGEVRAEAAERVSRLYPAGRTNLLPAIDEARRNLARAEAGRKHIIVVTDGKLPDEGPFYIELTKDLRLIGITLSTVLIGNEVDYEFLKNLADVGGGGFYQTADARNLPRIFVQDVKVSTGERTMKEQAQYAVRIGNGELTSTKLRTFPPIMGYVQTKPKNGSDLELVALAEDRAEPLLASWHYGKGKVAAYTSDATGRWSDLWVQWPKFHEFWSELIDSLRAAGGTGQGAQVNPFKFNLRTSVEQGELKLALELFGDRDPGEVTASLAASDGGEKPLVFSREAKGLYQATLRAPLPGRYEFHGTAGGSKLTPVAFYLSGELFGERKGMGFNRPLLERIASETGGAVNPDPDHIKNFSQNRTQHYDLSTWLTAIGMLLFAGSIVFRELPSLRRRFKFQAN